MRRLTLALSTLVAVSLPIAGCGGGGENPDGPPSTDAPPVNICGTAAGTISSYPGSFQGTTVGAGAELAVAEGACTDERAWFGADGDDQVINLTGLRADARYVVDLITDDDLSFYVATSCDAAGPAMGACLLHVDAAFTNETGDFVAPASGSVALIVDSFMNPTPPATGAYTVMVREAECSTNPECTDPNRPICDNFTCVQCATSFDCTGATTPVCEGGMCVAGPAQCTGDDGNEDDDGPAAATMINPPTLVTPTVTSGAVCNTPDTEWDWYTFTLAQPGGIRVELTYDTTNPANDLDVYLVDTAGGLIRAGENLEGDPELFVADLAAGSYYVIVTQFAPQANLAAVAYTMTLSIPECITAFECLTAAQPVCGATGDCEPGPANCTGDDAADAAPGDDGPAAATLMAGTTQTFNRQLCNDTNEADWYRAVMTAGQGLTISASFTDGEDFDVYAMDANGEFVGFTFWLNPETVTLTYLPAGPVYVQLVRFAPAGLAASAYSATFTKTAAAVCTSSADCAAEYETQVYRGQCTAGACTFLPPGNRAAGAPCDTGDDCGSGLCSYSLFEADAQDSVCTDVCAQTADCAAIGAGLTCTTGFSPNVCTPSCATDLECGARVGSSMVDTGLPWNYFTCTVASGVCSP